jgi:Asp-tRNA(Asn)/Glu-tRNA(Gln) amidotransferase C subunit
MSEGQPISREAFDEAAARLGIEGSENHMDDVYRQVRGVLDGTRSLLAIDVSGVEPDMAFRPTGSNSGSNQD